MRRINWLKYKDDPTCCLKEVSNLRLIVYDEDGRILKQEASDPTAALIAIAVEIDFRSTNIYTAPDLIILPDKYCWAVSKDRLSSLPVHNDCTRFLPWVTIGDRDEIIARMGLNSM